MTAIFYTKVNKYGIVSFSSFDNIQDIVHFDASGVSKIFSAMNNIRNYQSLGPDIRTDLYIKSLSNMFDTKTSKSPKAAVIVQDENSVSQSRTRAAAKHAEEFGINMISIGTGQIDVSEMEAISYFNSDHMKYLNALDTLNTEGLNWTLVTLKSGKFYWRTHISLMCVKIYFWIVEVFVTLWWWFID